MTETEIYTFIKESLETLEQEMMKGKKHLNVCISSEGGEDISVFKTANKYMCSWFINMWKSRTSEEEYKEEKIFLSEHNIKIFHLFCSNRHELTFRNVLPSNQEDLSYTVQDLFNKLYEATNKYSKKNKYKVYAKIIDG